MNWKFKKIKRQKETEIGRGKQVKKAKGNILYISIGKSKRKPLGLLSMKNYTKKKERKKTYNKCQESGHKEIHD